MSTSTEHTPDVTERAQEDGGSERTVHICLVAELETARFLGVDARTLCGQWTKPFTPKNRVELARDPDGRGWPVPKRRDCRECIAALEARLGRGHR